MTVFGDRALREVIKVKLGHKGESQSNRICVLIKKKKEKDTRDVSFSLQAERKDHVRTNEEGLQARKIVLT